MKVRRILALVLSAALAVTALTACTSAKDEASQKSADKQTTTLSYDTVKIGVIHIGNPADGSGYTYAHDQGIVGMQKELGLKDDQIVRKNNVSDSDPAATETAIRECIEEGCNIIFGTSWGYMDKMESLAEEYPDVYFCHGTGYKNNGKNLNNYFGRIYQARYLTGIVAGMKLNEMIANGDITEDQAKMGYVGAYTYAEVMSGYTSFFLGARSVCPSVTMDVTFTGSWYDETAEKEAANKLIEGGCVLISQHADSMGAPTACETAGVPNVSYNGSTEAACPNTFLVSSRVNWEPYFEYAIKCVADGTPIDTDWCGTLETGSVELSDLGAAVAEGTAEAVEAAKADLIAGKTHVYDITTFTVDGKTLDSYEADIDTDPDYTPDHEVVSDGYFHESEFASAPAFDILIDGITTIDN